ncbi:unnamed protein product [Heligmosomoides polygyrus]|uniref:HTH_48 domain-containing protein n=1 Tax=Heligmosomoides polygyrus TaxID=6339 RepID=A0A183FJT2_HELPZ|nr:unnamed protein product [Heligmosomoides polygyrus]
MGDVMIQSQALAAWKGWNPACPCERTVRLCFEKFAYGDFAFEENPGGGRRSSLDDEVLRTAVEANPETNTRALAEDLGVQHNAVAGHLARIGS